MFTQFCAECDKYTPTINRKYKNGYFSYNCAKCNRKTKFAYDPAHLDGAGIVDIAKNIWAMLKGPRTKQMPPSARKTVADNAERQIVKIDIIRTPLSAVLKGIARFITTRPFDELFHLALIIELDNGQQLLAEKNQVISVRPLRSSDVTSNTELEPVAVNQELNLGPFFERGIAAMGDRFFRYSAMNANCQDWVLGLLRANGLLAANDAEFIKQDTKDLLPSFWEKATDVLTDIAATVNVGIEGEGKGGARTEIHAVEMMRKYFTPRMANAWIKKHGFIARRAHPKANSIWYNQTNKLRYNEFRKKNIAPGINLVLGVTF